MHIAVIQMQCLTDPEKNEIRAEALVRKAADQGAQVVLLPELFRTPYFCKDERDEFFAWAEPAGKSTLLERFRSLAAETKTLLPVSFFEREANQYYNSIAVYDADGSDLGLYRKSHIPDGPGYEEKFYFRAGETGFKVFQSRYGNIGIGICWDQWFPECARILTLRGADVLLYPTAIGSEPHAEDLDTRDRWHRVMQGHAAANHIPVAAANRFGREQGLEVDTTFYGSSFITAPDGAVLQSAGRDEEAVLHAEFDTEAIRLERAGWGFFRDRRPELYTHLCIAPKEDTSA